MTFTIKSIAKFLTGIFLSVGFLPTIAQAAATKNWAIGLPEPVTPLAREMAWFHNDILLPVIIAISVFVLALLGYVCFRFSAKKNPTPTNTTHNPALEIAWTLIPVLILVLLAFPSLKLLYATDRIEDADMTLKITGHQWYWSYEYPDHDGIAFEAYMVPEEPGQENRLMMTDNLVVIPIHKTIRLQFTSADVLHNWAVSDFGVRMDTVPGRLNEAWMRVEKAGTYYGFCSELCGVNHAYMPIAVKAVTDAEFDQWLVWAKNEYANANIDLENQLATVPSGGSQKAKAGNSTTSPFPDKTYIALAKPRQITDQEN